MSLDRRAPEHDPGFAPEREATLHLFDGQFVQAEIEQQMPDGIAGEEQVARLPETLEPALCLAHAGPRLAMAARACPRMVDSEERGSDVPPQIGGARDLERRLEIRHGARVVAE